MATAIIIVALIILIGFCLFMAEEATDIFTWLLVLSLVVFAIWQTDKLINAFIAAG